MKSRLGSWLLAVVLLLGLLLPLGASGATYTNGGGVHYDVTINLRRPGGMAHFWCESYTEFEPDPNGRSVDAFSATSCRLIPDTNFITAGWAWEGPPGYYPPPPVVPEKMETYWEGSDLRFRYVQDTSSWSYQREYEAWVKACQGKYDVVCDMVARVPGTQNGQPGTWTIRQEGKITPKVQDYTAWLERLDNYPFLNLCMAQQPIGFCHDIVYPPPAPAPLAQKKRQLRTEEEDEYYGAEWRAVMYDCLRTNWPSFWGLTREKFQSDESVWVTLREDSPSENFNPPGQDYSYYTHEIFFFIPEVVTNTQWTLYYSTNLNSSWASNMNFSVISNGIAHCMTVLPESSKLFVLAKSGRVVSPVYGFIDTEFSGIGTNFVANPLGGPIQDVESVFPGLTMDDSLTLMVDGVRTNIQRVWDNGAWNGDTDEAKFRAPLGVGLEVVRGEEDTYAVHYAGRVINDYTNYLPASETSWIGAPVPIGGSFTNALRGLTPSEYDEVQYGTNSAVFYNGLWHVDFEVPIGAAVKYISNGDGKSIHSTWSPSQTLAAPSNVQFSNPDSVTGALTWDHSHNGLGDVTYVTAWKVNNGSYNYITNSTKSSEFDYVYFVGGDTVYAQITAYRDGVASSTCSTNFMVAPTFLSDPWSDHVSGGMVRIFTALTANPPSGYEAEVEISHNGGAWTAGVAIQSTTYYSWTWYGSGWAPGDDCQVRVRLHNKTTHARTYWNYSVVVDTTT